MLMKFHSTTEISIKSVNKLLKQTFITEPHSNCGIVVHTHLNTSMLTLEVAR